jgi:hypothetical protein
MAAPYPGSGNAYPTPAPPPPAAPYQSDQTYDPYRIAKAAYGGIKDFFGGIGNALSPTTPDLSGVQAAQKQAFDVQNSLAAERAGFNGAYNPAIGSQSIADLVAASHGATPSAAELQLQKQAGINAANQFGVAAALQGRNPGSALRSARMGALATQGQTNIDAAILRAKEQADARNALNAALAQQRQQDLGYQEALLSGQVGALGAGTNAAGQAAAAQAQAAAAQNAYKGSLIGGGASILGSIFSDRRMKRDVRKADLSKLAASIKGFRFKYKDPANGDGERVGVMAQDVARGGPVGERMVRLDRGRMKLDIGNAVGAALAMSAEALRKAS